MNAARAYASDGCVVQEAARREAAQRGEPERVVRVRRELRRRVVRTQRRLGDERVRDLLFVSALSDVS